MYKLVRPDLKIRKRSPEQKSEPLTPNKPLTLSVEPYFLTKVSWNCRQVNIDLAKPSFDHIHVPNGEGTSACDLRKVEIHHAPPACRR